MNGLIVATVTPFKDDGSLDIDALVPYVEYLKRANVDGFFINGTTGEFGLLSYEEKLEVAKKFLSIAQESTIVGINENYPKSAVKLAREVVDLGAKYIASLPPIYVRPSDKGIIQFYEELSKPGIPVIMYYYPERMGYEIDSQTIVKLVEEGLIDGIKYTTSNVNKFYFLMKKLREVRKDFKIYVGDDLLLMYGLALGADGAISGIANIAPELVKGLVDAVKAGDMRKAVELQLKVNELVEAVNYADYPTAIKEGLKYRGVFVGKSRSPLQSSNIADSMLYEVMKRFGL